MKCLTEIPIFLLFYFTSQSSQKPQTDSSVSGNLLEDTFALEDDLASRPFMLESGEPYRDLLTITAARNVAILGLSINRTRPQTGKPHKSSLRRKPSPKFSQGSYNPAPVYLTDREIFDFTDSRFIQPFPENIANYPFLVETSNNVDESNFVDQTFESFQVDL